MVDLRIVDPTEPGCMASFADQARAALEEALATSPHMLCIIYENADDTFWTPVPAGRAVLRGLVGEAHREINIDSTSND